MKIMKLEEQGRISKADNLDTRGRSECNTRVQEGTRSLFLHSCYFFTALVIALCFINGAAHAQAEDDPLAPKPNLMWLSDDVNVSVQNHNDDVFGLPKDSSYFNFDVKHRVFGSEDKSNLELGLGWQEMSIDSQFDASGPKVSLSGRYNVRNSVQVYGLTSYFPELEDELRDGGVSGYEIEAGLLYKPLPSWSLKAGYRVFSLDLEDPIIEELGSSSGFLLGTDLSW
jgi:hypothetical protein